MPQAAVAATPMKATALYRPLAGLACRTQDREHYLDVEAKLQKPMRASAEGAAPHHLLPSFCSPENLNVPVVVTGTLNIPQRTLGNNRSLQEQPI